MAKVKPVRMRYKQCCVNWPKHDVLAKGGLNDMIARAVEVSRETFRNNVDLNDLAELEEQLGYEKHYQKGMTMAADWHVAYYRSKLHGKKVYYFRHSSIEYVFVLPEAVVTVPGCVIGATKELLQADFE